MRLNADSFKAIYYPLHAKLYRIAYALTGNQADAEDILQDVYTTLWAKRETLAEISNPEAFCITLVKNRCLDMLRSSNRHPEEAIEEHLGNASDSTPEKILEEQEKISIVRSLLEKLPLRQQQIIRLQAIENCSYEEIEQITGLSNGNIRTLLSRIRKQLKEQLEKAYRL